MGNTLYINVAMKRLKITPPLPTDFIKIQLRGTLNVRKEKRKGKEYEYPRIIIKNKELAHKLPKEFTFFAVVPRPALKNKDKKRV